LKDRTGSKAGGGRRAKAACGGKVQDELRVMAEMTLEKQGPGRAVPEYSDLKKVVHELQVHQIELEMQNEELKEGRKVAEELHQKYVTLYDFAPVGYLSLEPGGRILELNLTASTLLGRPRSQIMGTRFQGFLARESLIPFRDFTAEIFRSGEDALRSGEDAPGSGRRTCEVGLISDGGEGRFLQLAGIPFHEGGGEVRLQMAMTEITDRRATENRLTESLAEKEVMLREIHHRVKNNLQLISSLLEMTRARSDDPYTRATLADVTMKIQTMAQIHTKVYESEKYDRVDLAGLVRDQVKALAQVYEDRSREIETTVAAAEAALPIDRAVPFALVVNEILSNAFKHAFAGRKKGKIEVTLAERGDFLRFSVRDDGVGMPPGFDVARSDTLGLKLVRTILERQLRGTLRYGRVRGTEVIVEVPIREG